MSMSLVFSAVKAGRVQVLANPGYTGVGSTVNMSFKQRGGNSAVILPPFSEDWFGCLLFLVFLVVLLNFVVVVCVYTICLMFCFHGFVVLFYFLLTHVARVTCFFFFF